MAGQRVVGSGSPSEIETLTIDEIERRHSGQWVLVRVTKMGERRQALAGQVLVSGARRTVYKRLAKVFAHATPEAPYFVFSAGSFVSLASTEPEHTVAHLPNGG